MSKIPSMPPIGKHFCEPVEKRLYNLGNPKERLALNLRSLCQMKVLVHRQGSPEVPQPSVQPGVFQIHGGKPSKLRKTRTIHFVHFTSKCFLGDAIRYKKTKRRAIKNNTRRGRDSTFRVPKGICPTASVGGLTIRRLQPQQVRVQFFSTSKVTNQNTF